MTARRIALLGAGSTGKTRLAGELADQLRARALRAGVVPDPLRAWCAREGCVLRPEERFEIAREQERQVEAATAAADVVIADTTALTVLAGAGMLVEDSAFCRFALARQQAYDATLLMGLDLPPDADGPAGEGAQLRARVDALLRTLLQRAAVPFQVVYGSGPLRLQGALAALASAGVLPAQPADAPAGAGAQRPWTWICEKCSDPACEHRLFTRLQARPARCP